MTEKQSKMWDNWQVMSIMDNFNFCSMLVSMTVLDHKWVMSESDSLSNRQYVNAVPNIAQLKAQAKYVLGIVMDYELEGNETFFRAGYADLYATKFDDDSLLLEYCPVYAMDIDSDMYEFNFAAMHISMTALDHKWISVGAVPNIAQLKEEAKRLYNLVFDHDLEEGEEYWFLECGGLRVTKTDDGSMSLEYIAEQAQQI